jgi:hypothetical protein
MNHPDGSALAVSVTDLAAVGSVAVVTVSPTGNVAPNCTVIDGGCGGGV